MPKIRLSAIATDIKGKSGGSVFSKNSGGTYFRNNPSGGGRKSTKWDLQKAKFADVSRQWRKLTEDEQDAWNSAVSEYPTVNAFGEPRLPSGYELFMRLNGTLISAGLPQLPVPQSKRTLPNIGSAILNVPDFFQFVPNVRGNMYNMFGVNNPLFGKTLNNGLSYNSNVNQFFSMRLAYAKDKPSDMPLLEDFKIFQLGEEDEQQTYLSVRRIDVVSVEFEFKFLGPLGSRTFTCEVLYSTFIEGVHIAFQYVHTLYGQSQFYINGVSVATQINLFGTYGTFSIADTFSWGQLGSSSALNLKWSDIRYLRGSVSANNVELVYLGYIPVVFDVMIPLTDTKFGSVSQTQLGSVSWAGTNVIPTSSSPNENDDSINVGNVSGERISVNIATKHSNSPDGYRTDNWTNANFEANRYIQYRMSPNTGFSFVVNNISFEQLNSRGEYTMSVYYSIDDFASSQQLGVDLDSSTSLTFENFSNLNIVVPPGASLSIRCYFWELSSFRGNIKNMVVSGVTVDSSPIQTNPEFSNVCSNGVICPQGYYCSENNCLPMGPYSISVFGLMSNNYQAGLYGVGDLKKWSDIYNEGIVPKMKIVVENQNETNTFLNLYCSPPHSAGKRSKTDNYKLLGTFPYGENLEYAISEAFKEVYSAFPPNAVLDFKLDVIDGDTGVLNETLRIASRKSDFKAGAELNKTVG